ncbi:MAG: polymerase III, subunit gamma and tau protein [Candidatus Roizmanbacteria bacterium GW2011_GWB1_40_7]|uniref:DNA polymerase III subunit gamma/tau n=3 Tax=Candidatus Roizmaniibacteriota TaxID=1752723 RepID=A0A0G0ZH02_9BACT|nr:MAG: polymerase III, subunit gamma and tau protein [Candidatus Roizmanbacteria bacterium GW2011_GWB1_40_7]KKR92786.1 MAG: polymerase III, subunit gamma and tau protein [Candidatus Roizmanbacteria bacterium GW2011_GWA1_41_13]KKS21316.1 MAG: polymerase III, subunit gamma and tau protein [Candidatus Roizmanbacteria bacterium GW2011_GWC2_41_7]
MRLPRRFTPRNDKESHMVFYRTYRPKLISQLDKTDVRERIGSLLQSKSVPHAFLFSGPRGTGKTSTARIVAKALNCEHVDKKVTTRVATTIEPCNKCSNCLAIINGTHMDVIEIDAASNRGIDEIRELRDKIALSPSMGKKKIYIIDEVHMLTREAFNALLKTLEEPPVHVTFILATTEPHKLPGTIISRCVQITFSKATDQELKRSLNRVIAGEKVEISDKALSLIVKSADGSFRDAVKILEQAVSENRLSDADISLLIGLTGNIDLIEIVLHRDIKRALSSIEEQHQNGTDFSLYIQSLLEGLHEQLLENPENTEVKKLIKYLMRAYSETKTTSIPQLPLELAVIEYCSN